MEAEARDVLGLFTTERRRGMLRAVGKVGEEDYGKGDVFRWGGEEIAMGAKGDAKKACRVRAGWGRCRCRR
jgi:hypothetical protein